MLDCPSRCRSTATGQSRPQRSDGGKIFSPPLTLHDLRLAFAELPPPVVVFNKSHSGSRLVAQLLEASGVWLGSDVNDSRDSVSLLKLVRYLVEHYYPDYDTLWHGAGARDGALLGLIQGAFADHLQGRESHAWGWKLSETVYVLPLIDFLFPGARYVHIIRDGRDVAFSNHVPPVEAFWQKVYVNAVGVRRWRGLLFGAMGQIGYRFDSSLYNAQHWVNSVELGRRYGAMLRERYLEVRYEDLCRDFDTEGRRLLAFTGAPDVETGLAAMRPSVTTESIGKFRRHNPLKVAAVKRYARPLLVALGYTD